MDHVMEQEVALAPSPRALASWSAPRPEVLAAISILLGATGQLVVKAALLLIGRNHLEPSVALRVYEPAAGVVAGLSIYVLGTLFWLKAVARASISYLYPLSAASYAIVALGGRVLFHESIQAGRWLGIGVISLGVALMALSNLRGSK